MSQTEAVNSRHRDLVLGLLFGMLASVACAFAASWYCDSLGSSSANQLQTLLREDFARLAKAHALPHQWAEIGRVDMRADGPFTFNLLRPIRFPVRTTPTGRYRLEVFGTTTAAANSDQNHGVFLLIRCDLVDLKSNNTVFEINRSYILHAKSAPPALPARAR